MKIGLGGLFSEQILGVVLTGDRLTQGPARMVRVQGRGIIAGEEISMEPITPSSTLGDWLDLRDEMRAAEVLLEDMQIAPADLAVYWAMIADLLALLQEIEEYLEKRRERGPVEDEAALYLRTRRRFTLLLAKAEEIGIPREEKE